MSIEIKYKVSVLVANYNNQKYLEQCLESILKQSYNNVEIIVIDDGSTDKSSEILEKYKNKITIVKKKNNKTSIGSYDQMESYYECLKISSGDLIFLCDSDDYFDEKKIELIVKKFNENNDYLMVYDLPILKFKNNIKYTNKKQKIFKNYWPYFPPTSCIAIKRNELINNFNSINFKNYPDIWLDFRLGIFSKYIFKNLIFINKNLTYYRQTDKNISSNFKFLSKNWWIRRDQAHEYVKFFLKKNKIYYKKNFDYFLTKIVNKILL